jgi:hypothetical protein
MAKFTIEPTSGGRVIWNPTNEDFDMQYAGVSFTIRAGEKKELEGNCAGAILNSYGPRGLTALKYGDEVNEAKIGADARERNHEFKTRQVVIYNQQNENRQHMKLGYLPPSEKIKAYALELGIKLLEPYNVREEERAGISEAKRENEALKEEMAELKAMLKQLITKEEPEKPSELRVRRDGKWVKEGT